MIVVSAEIVSAYLVGLASIALEGDVEQDG